MVELLLAHGAQTDIQDNQGQTPLHLAARNGHRLIVEELLKNGADRRMVDQYSA